MGTDPVPDPSLASSSGDLAEGDEVARSCAAHPDIADEIKLAARALRIAGAAGQDATQQDPGCGDRLGRLQIVGSLGRGGMGSVYRARDPGLHRDVAIKFLPASMAQAPEAIERFRREVQALGRIRHQHIVAIHDIGESKGVPWFTMDLVEGDSLRTILDRLAHEDVETLGAEALIPGAPSRQANANDTTRDGSYVEAVARLIAKLADALEQAHRAGIVHRDIKPGNVMVDRAGEPRIVDFGLARAVDAVTVTRAGGGPGTPAYMAPEQIAGRCPSGPATDVYALGVTLYEALTLRRPFRGETTDEVFSAVIGSEPVPPRRWNAQIPRDLEIVCLTAIEKDPASRYASAHAFAEDLRRLLSLQPIRARPAGLARRARRLLVRNPSLTVAAASLVLCAATLGILAVVQWWVVRVEFHAAVSATREAIEGNDLSRAESDLERVTAIDRDSVEARELSAALRDARARADHAHAIDEANGEVEESERSMAAIVASRARLEILKRDELFSTEPSADPLAWAREEDALGRLIVGAQEHLAAATDALTRAERSIPGTAAVRRATADLHMVRWRAALSENDGPMAAVHRARAEACDTEQRHRRELEGAGSVSIDGSPIDSEVHLFRYELMSRLREGGEPRLVPVPCRASGSAVLAPAFGVGGDLLSPGDVALSVTSVAQGSPAATVGLRARDLVTRFSGAPVGGAVVVLGLEAAGPAALAGVAGLQRLTRLAGREVRCLHDAVVAHANLAVATEYEAEFADARGHLTVSTRRGVSAWQDLGVRVGDVAEALASVVLGVDLELTVVSAGVARVVVLPRGAPSGVDGVVTAYPLLFTPENLLGTLPLVDLHLPVGSYLLVAGRPGHDDLRLPVAIPREGNVAVRVDLLRVGSTPPGFVFVAPGRSVYGGDPDAAGANGRRETDLGGYFIAQREVTVGEYAEFINDPATRQEIDEASRQGVVIRVPRRTHAVPSWERAVDGRLIPDVDARCAVCDIAAVDADAYVVWRNRMATSRGEAWTYALPGKEQWEKAARGADARIYPWGDAFAWSFCSGAKSRPSGATREPGLSFLADESPFGVRDLAGGVIEWLIDVSYFGVRPWRGGAWNAAEARVFRAASDNGGVPTRPGFNDGFRLVASPRSPPQDSRPQGRR